MATIPGTSPTRPSRADQFIERELGHTGGRMRTADIAWAVLAAIAWSLALLITLVVVDAWMVNLGSKFRMLGLVTLVAGAILIFCYGALPPLMRRINPQYVARMIEKSGNSLHNSLVNYLLVKNSPQKPRTIVYEAVSQRAANDLSQVDQDRRVDFSSAIRMGVVVAGLVAVMVAYIVFSPRNPWSSISRILAPGARIAPASVVTVTHVLPGDATVYYGDRLRVTCEVRGQTGDQPVQLVFSSRDGQIRNAVVLMESTGNGMEFVGEISGGSGGILTDLDYVVSCGDGRSPDYHVAVRANPTITVSQVEIIPPEYTRLPPGIQVGRGEIRAPEGSVVRISATSNQDIKIAWIELVSATQSGTLSTDTDNVHVVQSVNMEITDTRQSRGEFVLLLDADRKTQKFSHYRIRFRTAGDQRNELASLHPVQVIPDAAPEVSIVRPEPVSVELPVNSRLPIEIHASDLDYEISSIELVMDHRGSRLMDRTLDLPKEKENQQVTSRYLMDPTSLNLKVDDEVVFFARALDNRISPYSYAADPNESVTAPYTVRIVAADPNDAESNDAESNKVPAGDRDAESGNKDNSPGRSDPEKNQSGVPDKQSSPDNSGTGNGGQSGNNAENKDESQPEKAGSSTGNNKSPENRDSGASGEESKNTGEKGSGESGASDQSQSAEKDANKGSAGKKSEAGSGNAGGQTQSGSGEAGNTGGQEGAASTEKSGASATGNSASGNQASTNDAGSNSESGNSRNPGRSSASKENGNKSAGSSEGSGTGDGGTGDKNTDDNTGGTGSTGFNQTESSGQTSSQNSGDETNAGSGGQKDNSLRDGSVEPLSKKATESEKFEALQEYLGKNQEVGDSSASSRETGNTPEKQSDAAGSNQTGSTDPSGNQPENAGTTGKPGEKTDGANRANNNDSSGSDDSGTGNAEQSGQGGSGTSPKQDGDKSGNSGTDSGAGQKSDSGDGQSAGKGVAQSGSGEEMADKQGETGSAGSESATGESATGESATGESATGKSAGSEAKSGGDKSNPDVGPGNDNNGAQQTPQSGTGTKESGDLEKSSGNQSGQGTRQTKGESQSGEGGIETGQQSESSSGQSGSTPSRSGKSGENGGNSNGGGSGVRGGSGAGGSEAAGNSVDPQSTMSPQEAEQVEYNRAATDLILKSLDEQKERPDPDLLKRMNMTEQDLTDFLERWQKMKDSANAGDPVAKKRYTEALRSLSLRDADLRPSDVRGERDQVTGMAEDGGVNRPSAELAPEFRAFMKARNRVEKASGNR